MTWFIHFLASPAVEILVVLKHVPAIKVFVCVDQGLGDFAINTTKQKPFQSKQFKNTNKAIEWGILTSFCAAPSCGSGLQARLRISAEDFSNTWPKSG